MQFLKINDTTHHFQTIGLDSEKPVVVFINSLGTDYRIWRDVIVGMIDAYTVIAYDKRGHGLSDIGSTPYSMQVLADDLAALLDHLNVKSAIIVGLSVGGQIAQQLYNTRPDLVKALVLCDTAARIGDPEFWAQRISVIEEKGIAEIGDAILSRWFTEDFRRQTNPDFSGYRNMLIRQSAEGYIATCAAIRDFDNRKTAEFYTVPTLCVVGEQDGSTPVELVQAFAETMPSAKFEIIPNCGHIPCVEAPEPLTKIIRSFISSL